MHRVPTVRRALPGRHVFVERLVQQMLLRTDAAMRPARRCGCAHRPRRRRPRRAACRADAGSDRSRPDASESARRVRRARRRETHRCRNRPARPARIPFPASTSSARRVRVHTGCGPERSPGRLRRGSKPSRFFLSMTPRCARLRNNARGPSQARAACGVRREARFVEGPIGLRTVIGPAFVSQSATHCRRRSSPGRTRRAPVIGGAGCRPADAAGDARRRVLSPIRAIACRVHPAQTALASSICRTSS